MVFIYVWFFDLPFNLENLEIPNQNILGNNRSKKRP